MGIEEEQDCDDAVGKDSNNVVVSPYSGLTYSTLKNVNSEKFSSVALNQNKSLELELLQPENELRDFLNVHEKPDTFDDPQPNSSGAQQSEDGHTELDIIFDDPQPSTSGAQQSEEVLKEPDIFDDPQPSTFGAQQSEEVHKEPDIFDDPQPSTSGAQQLEDVHKEPDIFDDPQPSTSGAQQSEEVHKEPDIFDDPQPSTSGAQQLEDVHKEPDIFDDPQPSTSGAQGNDPLDCSTLTDKRHTHNRKHKIAAKKSYADYMSEDEELDFQPSSSSWAGSETGSDVDSDDNASSKKKKKSRNSLSLEDGKIGEEGLRKKNKSNKRKEYTTKSGSIVKAKEIKPNPCSNKKCGRSCFEIPEQRRQNLFNYFQSLSCERKRDWLVSNSQVEQTKRKRSKENSRRNLTFMYFINEGEGRRQVCLQFILNTLDITQRYVYYTLSNAHDKLSKNDMRGKHVPPNKTTEELRQSVIEYIKNLPAVPSHYCRKDSTRLYLPQELKNIANLYQLYKKDYQSKGKDTVGEKVFSNIFKSEFNISFHKPKKDKCLKCITFSNNPEASVTAKEIHLKEAEDSKERFKFHQKITQNNPNTLCVSFDLQKVLGTPYGERMLFYYSRKYSVYNLTFYESTTREVYCYTWGEADGNRGGNEIGTILYNYIKMIDERKTVKKLLLYSDSCSGQNRNKIVFTAVHSALQSCKSIDTIQMNFLLPGHTTMPVDSVHAVIERSVDNMIIYAPSQWPTVFELARKNPKPYNVDVLNYKDFKAWDTIADKYFKNNLAGKVKKLRIITFKKSELQFVYLKYSMNETAKPEKIEVSGKTKTCPDNAYKSKLSISKEKQSDLVKLCKSFAIPQRYHSEYLNLQSSANKTDHLPDSDIEDDLETE